MRCRRCDYALWDLPSRKCPECGAPFKPSEYEFQPGAVQYLCPHCRQNYYGTDPKGHLWPRSFTCVKCNRPIEMDEMLLVPAEGWTEAQTAAETLPWLNRAELGFIKGFFRTVWMALTTPSRVMQLLPTKKQASGRMWFAFLANAFVGLVALIPFAILQMVLLGSVSGSPGRMFAIGGIGLFVVAVTIAVPLLAIVMWSLVTHSVLRLTGKTQGDFSDTFSAFCYSAGANVASAIPCLGLYCGWIWWTVSAIFMVRERHKVHGARATLAVCMGPGIAIAAVVVIEVLLVYYSSTTYSSMTVTTGPSGLMTQVGYTSSGAAALPPGVSAETQTADVYKALVDYAVSHDGKYPLHATMLAIGNYFDPYEFAAAGTPTMPDQVRLDDTTTLLDFFSMDPREQTSVANRLARKMPPNVVAHRIGDYVMTYHGIDGIKNPSGLWMVIRHVPAGADRRFGIYIATNDGRILNYSDNEFRRRLSEQNALRARRGLPPLPHPDQIKDGKPFTAAGANQAAPEQ